jgi:nuclear pore complex protein Nup205
LKAEADYVTLSMLEEIHLLVTMCGVLLPAVPKAESVCPDSPLS